MNENADNLEKVKQQFIALLYLPVEKTEFSFIVHHPFTSNSMAVVKSGREASLIDITTDSGADEWRSYMKAVIKDYYGDIPGLFAFIINPYVLFALKTCLKYMSPESVGSVFHNLWITIEQISTDPNVSRREIIAMLEYADKTTLMNEEELLAYSALPQLVTVYRGITSYNIRSTKAISWSLSRSTAEWFAKRFNSDKQIVLEKKIPKSKIICIMLGRGEQEVLVKL